MGGVSGWSFYFLVQLTGVEEILNRLHTTVCLEFVARETTLNQVNMWTTDDLSITVDWRERGGARGGAYC